MLAGIGLALACRTPPSSPLAEAPAPGGSTGLDPKLIDPRVKPCDDFYAYACGGWLATFELPPDKSRYTRGFSAIEERNLALLRDIAAEQAAGTIDPRDRYARKVGDYWAACMDEEGIEQRGTRELLAAWAQLDAVKDVAGLAQALGTLHKSGTSPAFDIGSQQDARDATQVIGVIAQGGLSLPDRDYYLQSDPRTLAVQRSFRDYVAQLFRKTGASAEQAAAAGEAVYGLEHAMAEAHYSRVEMRDPQRTFNRIDRAGLERAMPHFPWARYLAALGHPDLRAFTVTTPPYLARLDSLLDRTPMATWRTYLKWKLLAKMARERALPRGFTDAWFAFSSKNFSGAKDLEPRWKHCVREVDDALGEALGQAYVRRYFGERGREQTSALVAGIEGAMSRDLDALGWMDAPTRGKAHEKLAQLVNKVGYPTPWRNYDRLEVDRQSFFRSLSAAQAFEVNRQLEKIGKPLDRGEWGMSPPTVNAYYDPSMNEMVFPAGILQPPFFTIGAPDAVNFGAIGMVVGHELTHGFDDQGRQFDARGNLVDWWTPAVGQEFDRRAACVVKQFSGYVAVDDLRLNGQLTLGENIADLGGLKLAFAAYRASRVGRGGEAEVAGFTPEQAFFVGYAQAWCTAARPEDVRLRARTDPHAPPRWRVNGPLSNLAEFQQAFDCPSGSRMVREAADRCEIW